MANRKSPNDFIIRADKQEASQVKLYKSGIFDKKTDPRDTNQLRQENNYLKLLINQLKQNNPVQEHVYDQGGLPSEFSKKMDSNQRKINQLNNVLNEQNQIMKKYQHKFDEFSQNLQNLMKLDKDIHFKLNNRQQSSTLDKNVKNVLVALNSGAPYEKLINMIDNIKI